MSFTGMKMSYIPFDSLLCQDNPVSNHTCGGGDHFAPVRDDIGLFRFFGQSTVRVMES